MKTVFAILSIVAFVIFVIVVGPLLTLWSWNQLFGQAHPLDYSLMNWLAVVILGAFFRANVSIKKKE